MRRVVLCASVALAACGRSQGIPDQDLGDLVLAPRPRTDPIDVARAAKDPDELGRALELPAHVVAAALGPHVVTIATATTVSEDGKSVQDLSDTVTIELGDKGAYHATYTNSADYGREVIWLPGTLYLRPRYQRWHGRAPETPEEPEQLHDELAGAIAATWELFAPGAQVSDAGRAEVAGRAGEKLEVRLAAEPKAPPPEPLVQRKWREHRTFDELSGEVVLDAATGVPLAVKLAGTIGFARDGRKFAMKVTLDASVSGVGQAVAIAAPATEDVVATPERLREVDDRDFLLQGIAPPSRHAPEASPDSPHAPGAGAGGARP